MKTDAQLKIDITNELDWDPSINPSHVGVVVNDGVVTLVGHLDTFAEKAAVERAVQRVAGVRALAIELDVKLALDHQRGDSDIAQAAESVLKWHALVPAERIQVKVEKGWVTLDGELDWEFQRAAAEKAVRALTGVVGVSNALRLQQRAVPADVSSRIRDALTRHAQREAKAIDVSVSGGTATLHGRVDSWAERAAANGAAWSAPGITMVVSKLTVGEGS